MYCKICGTEIKEKQLFCPRCGTSVGSSNSTVIPGKCADTASVNKKRPSFNGVFEINKKKILYTAAGLVVLISITAGIIVSTKTFINRRPASIGSASGSASSEDTEYEKITAVDPETDGDVAEDSLSTGPADYSGDGLAVKITADNNWDIYELSYATGGTILVDIAEDLAAEGKISEKAVKKAKENGDEYISLFEVPEEKERFKDNFYGVWTSTDGLFEKIQSDHPEMHIIDNKYGDFRGINLGVSGQYGFDFYSYVTADNYSYTGEKIALATKVNGNDRYDPDFIYPIEQVDEDTIRIGEVEFDYLFDLEKLRINVTYNGTEYTMVPAYLAYEDDYEIMKKSFGYMCSGLYSYNDGFINALSSNLKDLGDLAVLIDPTNGLKELPSLGLGAGEDKVNGVGLRYTGYSSGTGIGITQTGSNKITFSYGEKTLEMNYEKTEKGVNIGGYSLTLTEP